VRESTVPREPIEAPSAALLALEVRSAPEFAAFLASWPLLSLTPRGDGHTVLVLPPFAVSDTYTQPLRSLLQSLGYDAQGWNLGQNLGRTAEVMEGVPLRLLELHELAGDPVSIVGWSMGGVLARELARDHPHAVRQVISLGAPFRLRHGDQHKTNASWLYEMVKSLQAPPSKYMTKDEHERPPLLVPSTAIYSRSDGVASWRACVDEIGPQRENIEVHSSHCGFGHNPAAVYAVLDRLAQPRGSWKPFQPPLGTGRLYPPPVSGPE
jgi:alpha/beta hydrolase fold